MNISPLAVVHPEAKSVKIQQSTFCRNRERCRDR